MGDASKLNDGFGHDGIPPFGSSVLVQAPVPKSGFATSELYVWLASALAALLSKKLGLDVDPSILVTVLATAGAYILSRTWLKALAAKVGVTLPQS